MRWVDSVASYLPSLIVQHLLDDKWSGEVPCRQEYDTVCVFCDVSGFTALSERMMLEPDNGGVEGLARHLNAYFGQMVRIIASEGGDVLKFAGDAMIVLWPPPTRDELGGATQHPSGNGHSNNNAVPARPRGGSMEIKLGGTPMERRVRRAAQCAFAIQEELGECEMAEGITLKVKIGIGMGKVSVLHLGNVYGRMEYIAVGEPLLQAFQAEHHASPKDVIISEPAFKLIKDHFQQEKVYPDNYVLLRKGTGYIPLRKVNKHNMLQIGLDDDPLLKDRLQGYMPGAASWGLHPDSRIEDEFWNNEVRRVTVLFVNLGVRNHHLLAAARYDEAMNEINQVMVAVQESVYEYEGSINKFLMDDKGSTLVAVFGLPPVAHADDPVRGTLAALRLCERLFDLGYSGSVGITTGEAFCGVVGSKTRREYTVLGDTVNLAARLMQRATTEEGGVLCDLNTNRACAGLLQFKPRGDFKVKGKITPVKVFQPYPADFPKPKPPEYLGPNHYGVIHHQQKQNFAMHRLLTSLQAYFSRPDPALLGSVSAGVGSAGSGSGGMDGASSGGGSPRSDGSLRLSRRGQANDAANPADEHLDSFVNMGHDNFTDLKRRSSRRRQDSTEGFADGALGGAENAEESEASSDASDSDNSVAAPASVLVEPGGEDDGSSQSSIIVVPAAARGKPALPPKGATQQAAGDGTRRSSMPSNFGAPQFASTASDLKKRSSGSLANLNTSAAGTGYSSSGSGAATLGSAPSPEPGDADASQPRLVVMRRLSSRSYMKKVFERGKSFNTPAGDDPELSATSPMTALPLPLAGGPEWRAANPLDGTGSDSKLDCSDSEFGHEGQGSDLLSSAKSSELREPSSADAAPAKAAAGFSSQQQKAAAQVEDYAREEKSLTASVARRQGGSGEEREGEGELAAQRDEDESLELLAEQFAMAQPSASAAATAGDAEAKPEFEDDVSAEQATVAARNWSSGSGKSVAMAAPLVVTAAAQRHRQSASASGTSPELKPGLRKTLSRRKTFADLDLSVSSKRSIGFSNRGTKSTSAQDALAAEEMAWDADGGIGQTTRVSSRVATTQNGLVPVRRLSAPGMLTAASARAIQSAAAAAATGGAFGPAGANSASGMDTSAAGTPKAMARALMTAAGAAPSGVGGQYRRGVRRKDFVRALSSAALQLFNYRAGESYDHFMAVAVLPTDGKPSRLDDNSPRLGPIAFPEAKTFAGLRERVWSIAKARGYLRGPLAATQPDDFVLNIMGTRAFLPAMPDYSIQWLPAFVAEAWVTTYRRMHNARRLGGGGVIGNGAMPCPGVVELCLALRTETLDMESRWHRTRMYLLERKIDLVWTGRGSLMLLEGGPGVGKTEALGLFAAHSLPGTAYVHFTAASPYQYMKPFGAWCMVLQEYLNASPHAVAGRSSSLDMSSEGGGNASELDDVGSETDYMTATDAASNAARRRDSHISAVDLSDPVLAAAARTVAIQRELADRPELLPHLHLVNSILGTNVPVPPPAARRVMDVVGWGDEDSGGSSDSESEGSSAAGGGDSVTDGVTRMDWELRLRIKILLCLMENMARSRPRVVIIDDAQFLDKASWTLTLALASAGPDGGPLPMMVVLAMRPMAQHRGLFAPLPPDYFAVCESPSVTLLKIDGLPPEEIDAMVADKLGSSVVSTSDKLFALIEDACMGNPFLANELIGALKAAEPPLLRYTPANDANSVRSRKSESDGSGAKLHVSLTERFRLDLMPVPHRVEALYTALCDRLSLCALMILKVASMLSREFSGRALADVFPMKGHKPHLARELAKLQELGFLIEVKAPLAPKSRTALAAARRDQTVAPPSTAAAAAASNKAEEAAVVAAVAPERFYRFTLGFMREMLQRKMLSSQRENLRRRNEKRNRAARRNTVAEPGPARLSQGLLQVQKNATWLQERIRGNYGEAGTQRRRKGLKTLESVMSWKQRYCQVIGVCLTMRKGDTSGRYGNVHQSLYLLGASAAVEPSPLYPSGNVFRVDCRRWEKADHLHDEPRRFYFLARSREDADAWVNTIKYSIEMAEKREDDLSASRAGSMTILPTLASTASVSEIAAPDADAAAGPPPPPPLVARVRELLSPDRSKSGGSSGSSSSRADSVLVVRVEGASGLARVDIYGSTCPYCVLRLDSQQHKTDHVQPHGTAPEWGEDVVFPATVSQWRRGELCVQVWNHDPFLSKDFLGTASVSLDSLTPTPAPAAIFEGSGGAGEAELLDCIQYKELQLGPRGPQDRVLGSIRLGVCLLAAADTMALVERYGGPESIKLYIDAQTAVRAQAGEAGKAVQRLRQNGLMGGRSDNVGATTAQLSRPEGLPHNARMSFRASVRASMLAEGLRASLSRRRSSMGSDVSWATNGQSTDALDQLTVSPSMANGELTRRSRHSGRKSSIVSSNFPSDAFSRQLQLALLALESHAPATVPRHPNDVHSVIDRDWMRSIIKKLLDSSGKRGDAEFMDEVDMAADVLFCRDRGDVIYGPFPRHQLVEARNKGLLNERVKVKEAGYHFAVAPHGNNSNNNGNSNGLASANGTPPGSSSGSLVPQQAHKRGSGFHAISAMAPTLTRGSSADGSGDAGPIPIGKLRSWPRGDSHHMADKLLNRSDPKRDFRCWEFDVFALEPHELGLLAATIIVDTNLPHRFQVPVNAFGQFMQAVSFFMQRRPTVTYHNMYHAVDVMQGAHFALAHLGAGVALTALEDLALLIAAVAHDLDHPGLSNNFQIATQSELAIRYNDQSPLENHHVSILFSILRRPSCDILANVSPVQRTAFRKVVVAGILATDMAHHMSGIRELAEVVKQTPLLATRTGDVETDETVAPTAVTVASVDDAKYPRGRVPAGRNKKGVRGADTPEATGMDSAARQVVFNALLHCADLGSPARPFAVCRQWVERLMAEFQAQAAAEKAIGLPVTVLSSPTYAMDQVRFVDYMVMPLYAAVKSVVPGASKTWVHHANQNRLQWLHLADEQAAVAEAEVAADGSGAQQSAAALRKSIRRSIRQTEGSATATAPATSTTTTAGRDGEAAEGVQEEEEEEEDAPLSLSGSDGGDEDTEGSKGFCNQQ